ncbi:unnamed protein product [Prunus brigantina]
MSNLRRVLERQEREEEEIQCRRAEEDPEADEEEEEMLVAAVCMLNESRQPHRRRAPNMDRRRESRVLGLLPKQKLTVALRMLAYRASAEQVDEIARMGKSTILECLVRFCDAVENLYTREYLCTPTHKDLQRLLQKVEARVAGSQNDLNVLGQSPVFNDVLRGHSPQITYRINNTEYSVRWAIIKGAARMLDEEVLRSIMRTCIILHNMIVEDMSMIMML